MAEVAKCEPVSWTWTCPKCANVNTDPADPTKQTSILCRWCFETFSVVPKGDGKHG